LWTDTSIITEIFLYAWWCHCFQIFVLH
jgi:hypothetical protein